MSRPDGLSARRPNTGYAWSLILPVLVSSANERNWAVDPEERLCQDRGELWANEDAAAALCRTVRSRRKGGIRAMEASRNLPFLADVSARERHPRAFSLVDGTSYRHAITIRTWLDPPARSTDSLAPSTKTNMTLLAPPAPSRRWILFTQHFVQTHNTSSARFSSKTPAAYHNVSSPLHRLFWNEYCTFYFFSSLCAAVSGPRWL